MRFALFLLCSSIILSLFMWYVGMWQIVVFAWFMLIAGWLCIEVIFRLNSFVDHLIQLDKDQPLEWPWKRKL